MITVRLFPLVCLALTASAAAAEPLPMHSSTAGCAHLETTGEMLIDTEEEPPVYFDGTTLVFGPTNKCTVVATATLPDRGDGTTRALMTLYCEDWDLHSPSVATMARHGDAITLSLDVPPHNLWFALTRCEIPDSPPDNSPPAE